ALPTADIRPIFTLAADCDSKVPCLVLNDFCQFPSLPLVGDGRLQPLKYTIGDKLASRTGHSMIVNIDCNALVDDRQDCTVDDRSPKLLDQIKHQGRLPSAVDMQKPCV